MREKPNDSAADIIVCRDVHKWFANFEALRGITLSIKTGEVVVIIGPSGSGKSTFIRTLNRLEQHEQGQIIIDGIELTHATHNIQEVRAEVGMVFQSFNLFPHLTVLENIMLAPMHVRRWPRDKAHALA
ncbi:MAG: amino-acid transporter subunit, partial [Chloroflexota bacterium]